MQNLSACNYISKSEIIPISIYRTYVIPEINQLYFPIARVSQVAEDSRAGFVKFEELLMPGCRLSLLYSFH